MITYFLQLSAFYINLIVKQHFRYEIDMYMFEGAI